MNQDVLSERPIVLMPGGSALNTAVQLAHLIEILPENTDGVSPLPPLGVRLHSVVGEDAFGVFLKESVARHQVELSIPDPKVKNGWQQQH